MVPRGRAPACQAAGALPRTCLQRTFVFMRCSAMMLQCRVRQIVAKARHDLAAQRARHDHPGVVPRHPRARARVQGPARGGDPNDGTDGGSEGQFKLLVHEAREQAKLENQLETMKARLAEEKARGEEQAKVMEAELKARQEEEAKAAKARASATGLCCPLISNRLPPQKKKHIYLFF